MIRVAEIINAAKVEFSIGFAGFFARRLVKDFPAQSQSRSYVPLQKPAGKPPVAVVFARIDPIAASTEGCPRDQNYFEAIGEEKVERGRLPKPSSAMPLGSLNKWKDTDLGKYRSPRKSDISLRIQCRHNQSVSLHETAL